MPTKNNPHNNNSTNSESPELIRLHRYLAQSGVASRRKSEELILEGRIQVNGETITTLGTKVDPTKDSVTYDGAKVQPQGHATYLFYKPKGILTTMFDPEGRPTVAQYLPPDAPSVKPVGRLDKETDGLLILTNDGDLAARLTHAKYGVEKEYRATVRGTPSHKILTQLSKGIRLEGRITAPAQFELRNSDDRKNEATLNIILHEGRKRQIRLMLEQMGHPVLTLRRIRFGPLNLTKLQPGQMRILSKAEVQNLRRICKLP